VTSVAAITRRVPEGLWDPTKIPGIQDSLSVGGFLFSVGGVALSQIDTHIGPTRSVRQIQLDGTKRSHNLKVAGLNSASAAYRRS